MRLELCVIASAALMLADALTGFPQSSDTPSYFMPPAEPGEAGHSALAFALIKPYEELYHAPVLYARPVAVGFARVAAVDGHWASDTVGGAFVGWLTADLTRRFFPNSDYGSMIFGDGQQMMVGFHGSYG